ncbi:MULTISPECIES: sugar phosphate isomerase/epimerase and 4-hydroxyphenylpyruvate domain-containing protein [unclassified Sinorhizobium]|uniref:bifunctional sugar phosphate isomerase/epimerase/4-hydroxyphenylpyruvate dioxygenase family protein n=1 Tax=unclassified Sinorhizobium TaxID=2613772 RepID=UPI0024C30101|nr:MULTISPECIES: sugar phosphate isomerase/epimerase and 4-hydroxyphenylpyruvate domain-containing protein [unclassified Sinorhizobium]MDK1378235.1 TIM barrel protein [Sinorhizobium sp. 6-70]MDK1480382.1 TIM barrel protein [Sinorhizobium sp. 6-117]
MKTSMATASLGGEFPEKLAAIAKAGFTGVEIFENDFLTCDASPRQVASMAGDQGLDITLFQPFRDFEGMPGPHRARAFERAERKFEVMGELGTDLMLICSNVSPISLGGIDRAVADFYELGERAAKHGVRVGFEALAWGRHINDHRDAWEIVRRANHPNIGLILDSFHTLSRKIDPNTIRSIPGDKIFIVQLADAPLIDMDLLYWSRHFRNMPGEGDLPVVDFMRAVAATGYDGPLSLEIFNDQFRGGSARTIAEDGHRSLVYLMDQVARQEPDIRIDVPQMPIRISAEGVEFLEFTTGGDEKENLEALLVTLGFSKTARHRNRAVDLYTQADIRIVINTDASGDTFAASSYSAHGTNAYAFGMKVDDAQAALRRAQTLGAVTFCEPRRLGEVTVPAIHGVGNSVIYFLDGSTLLASVWDQEFVSAQVAPSSEGAGLTRIDHLAQTTRYDEMLTWLLFYTSIFDTERTPMIDVVDPGGLVRSQAIESTASRGFRLTMNGVDNRKTFAGKFLAEGYGTSIQHVAFATEDIFETTRILKTKGFQPLPISPNYYDDLQARFDLEPAFSDRLKAASILYDRDEHGEYFQVYSRPFGEGFFFEIVERRGPYTGYGALNAPFRIAAQRRLTRPDGLPKV